MAYTTIDDPSAYFQTALYTGTGSNQSITNDGNSDLQPDLVWVKDRSATNDHKITDSNRLSSGNPTITLESNTNTAEYDDADPAATTSFNSDGFTIGTNGNYNTNTNTYVAWQWKANGGTTSTDTNGAVNSTVQANTTAGFSIVTWTSAGSTNVGHGLGVAPNLIIIKARNATENWLVSSDEIVWTKRVKLNSTDASANSSAFGQAPTSSIFYCSPANSSYNYVAYCFAEVQGYSKFGSYVGNANDDGPFIYTGFKPKFAIFKATSTAGEGWAIRDSARDPFNQMSGKISANVSATEGTAANDNDCDFVSNGIKLRSNDNQMNKTGVTFVYMAFAEHPFVSSEGVPCTAR